MGVIKQVLVLVLMVPESTSCDVGELERLTFYSAFQYSVSSLRRAGRRKRSPVSQRAEMLACGGRGACPHALSARVVLGDPRRAPGPSRMVKAPLRSARSRRPVWCSKGGPPQREDGTTLGFSGCSWLTMPNFFAFFL
jgi:hypothetical protein